MEQPYDLVIVNPYTETEYTSHSKTHVNVGILSLASYIDKNGYKVKILDYRSNKDFLSDIEAFIVSHSIKILAISSTSCFSLRSLKAMVQTVKVPNDCIVIVGGQTIAGLGTKIFEEIPSLQYACFSEGESTLLHILKNYTGNFLDAPGLVFRENGVLKNNESLSLSFEELGKLNYKLYPNYRNIIPTVEESRGCPYKCNFCANRKLNYKVRIKHWEKFIQEVLEVYDFFGIDKLFINIGCSTFGMDHENTINLFKALVSHRDKFLIQAWTRCDVALEEWIPYLKQLNITSVFFGIESVSEEILMRMNKTKNPKEYVARTQRIIDLCYENNIKLWCNFVFGYVGETPATLETTIKFILKNKEKIGFLSGHGLIAFPGNQVFEEFDKLQKQYGISFEENDKYSNLFYHSVNPSINFTANQIKTMAQVLQKIVNSEEDFKQIFAWRYLGQDKDSSKLEEKMSYLKQHELPYCCEFEAN